MNLTDKQIKEIMELSDNYALVYGFSYLSTRSKARAALSRFKLEKNLMLISNQADNKEHKPVYEYQWLIKYLDGELVITGFHKTEEYVWNNYSNGIAYVERLEKYKREVKE